MPAKKKYAKYIITEDIRSSTPPPAGFVKRLEDQRKAGNYTTGAHVLSLNDAIVKGAFHFDAVWMVDKHGVPPTNIEIAHSHDFDEIIGFFGGYAGDAHDLGGEVEIWLEGEKHLITQSALVFTPAGMNHCPLNLNRVDRPIFHFSVVTAGEYIVKPTTENKNPKPDYSEHIVTELKEPEERKRQAPVYNQYAQRVLWLDTDVVTHSFNINVSWYLKASTTVDDKPHTHTRDEIIGFFSNDPENPNDLGGEVEIWVGDEKFNITKSAMLFIPAGMVHCPLILKRVTRPIFHFTVVKAPRYIKYEKV
jgi:mannose-6-phosphate isomerase-like protein (cupin superfamily)